MLIKNLSINTLNRATGLIFNLFVSVFFAREIGPEGIGPFVIALSTASLMVLITDQGYSSTLVLDPCIRDLSAFFSSLRISTLIFFFIASILFLLTSNYFVYFVLIKWLVDSINIMLTSFVMGRNSYDIILKISTYSYLLTILFLFILKVFIPTYIIYFVALLVPVLFSITFCFLHVKDLTKIKLQKAHYVVVKDRSIWLHDISSGLTGAADKLILGLFFPLGQIALFDRAKQIVRMPVSNLSLIVQPVILSNWTNNNIRIKWIYLIALFLFSALFKLLSRDLYIFAFGKEWEEGADYFCLLVTILPFSMILALTPGIYKKIGRSRKLLILGMLNLLVVLVPFIVGGLLRQTLMSSLYYYIVTYYVYFLYCILELKSLGILSKYQLIGVVMLSTLFFGLLVWI